MARNLPQAVCEPTLDGGHLILLLVSLVALALLWDRLRQRQEELAALRTACRIVLRDRSRKERLEPALRHLSESLGDPWPWEEEKELPSNVRPLRVAGRRP